LIFEQSTGGYGADGSACERKTPRRFWTRLTRGRGSPSTNQPQPPICFPEVERKQTRCRCNAPPQIHWAGHPRARSALVLRQRFNRGRPFGPETFREAFDRIPVLESCRQKIARGRLSSCRRRGSRPNGPGFGPQPPAGFCLGFFVSDSPRVTGVRGHQRATRRPPPGGEPERCVRPCPYRIVPEVARGPACLTRLCEVPTTCLCSVPTSALARA